MRSTLKASKSQKAWIIPGLLVLGVFFLSSPAQAQSNRDINNRLNRIENEIETLSRSVYKGEAPPAGSFSGSDAGTQANTEVRLQQVESELQQLRGMIEEQGHQVRQMQEQLERALSDMEMRLGDIEGGRRSSAGTESAGSYTARPSQAQNGYDDQPANTGEDFQWSSGNGETNDKQLGTLTENNGPATDSAATQYESAFSLLKNGQYDDAEVEFQGFIDKNPNHVLVGNAKYWLGETYYVRGEFEKAARLFAEGYQKYPKGPKAADNLLKLGMSLAGLGKSNDACVALQQLKKDFPSGSAPVLRRAEQEMSRLKCT